MNAWTGGQELKRDPQLRIGIDASNIRAGGGLTHLVEVLRHVQPEQHGIEHITVWGGRETLERLPQQTWLHSVHEPMLDRGLPQRVLWQRLRLARLAEQCCDVLFVPGGTYSGSFRPFVTMSQNLLPFVPNERRRYGLTWARIRLHLLEYTQTTTFRQATGIVFLTESLRQIVRHRLGSIRGKVAVVPYGVAAAFRRPPPSQQALSAYSLSHPFRWLYVSIVNVYKHQWQVAEAVARLKQDGIPVALDLVGPAYGPALSRLQEVILRVDPNKDFINYVGFVHYTQLPSYYHRADGFVFASSCEAFGQTLLEAMASGLPIACSHHTSMPETLGDAGVYFDPECSGDIAHALYSLMNDLALRERYAWSAYKQSQSYSWQRCARETFSFIADVAHSTREKDDYVCVESQV